MTDNTNIPVLTDLIEKGVQIELSELGLDQDPPMGKDAVDIVLGDEPALEKEIRRILDEHMELAWQEIKIAIQHARSKSSTE